MVGGTLSILVLPVVTYWIAPGIVLLILLWCLEQSTAEPVVSFIELGVAIINAFADVLAPFAQSISWTGWMFMVLGCMLLAVRWSSVFACLISSDGVWRFGTLMDEPVARLRIDALDVGQGDATLIRTSDGQSIPLTPVVSRGGVGEDGYHDAIVELRRLGISRIDMIIVSHLILTTLGRWKLFFGVLRLGNSWLIIMHPMTRLERTIRAGVLAKIACQLSLPEYFVWQVVKRALKSSAWLNDGPYLTDNERSLTLRVSEDTKVRLTGDLPSGQAKPIEKDRDPSVTKLGHHGSHTSSDRFLEVLRLNWFGRATVNSIGLGTHTPMFFSGWRR